MSLGALLHLSAATDSAGGCAFPQSLRIDYLPHATAARKTLGEFRNKEHVR